MDRIEFETLFLHAGLLPQLALAQMTSALLAAPREALSEADARTLADESARNEQHWLAEHPEGAPGEHTDWFGEGGLSEEEHARLLADAQRELAEFAQGQGAAPAAPPTALPSADAPTFEGDLERDLERDLAQAYADRAGIAAQAQRAYGQADLPALEATLARLSAGRAPLTAPLTAAQAGPWVALACEEDPVLMALVQELQRLARP